MRIYLSDSQIEAPTKHLARKLNYRTLFSYHYYRKADFSTFSDEVWGGQPWPDVLADSGAFSAYRVGAKIDVDDYIAWLHQVQDYFSWYVNLDMHGEEEISRKNQQRMEAAGLKPVPVWHLDFDRDYLHECCERYPLVGIGGFAAVGQPQKTVYKLFAYAHKVAQQYGAVLHLFGSTNLYQLTSWPWYSCDSTSWMNGNKYGLIRWWDQGAARLRDIAYGNVPFWMNRAYELNLAGVSWKDMGQDPRRYDVMYAVSVYSYQKFEKWLTDWHGPVEPRGPIK